MPTTDYLEISANGPASDWRAEDWLAGRGAQRGGLTGTLATRSRFILGVIVFKLTLDLIYALYLSVAFERHFLTAFALDINPWRYALAFGLAVLPTLVVPYDKRDISGIYFFSAMAFLYLPLTTMVGMDQSRELTTVLLTLMGLAISVAIIGRSPKPLTQVRLKNGPVYVFWLSVAAVATFVLITIFSDAVGSFNLDVTRIYEFRELQSEFLDEGLLAYFNIWAQKIFAPFLLIYGLVYRKWPVAVVAALLFVFFFGITQHRSHLFAPLLVLGVWQFYRSRLNLEILYFIVSIGLLFVLALWVFFPSFGVDNLAAIVVRRAFFVAPSVTTDFVAYFSEYPKVYWSDNLLKNSINSTYNGVSIPDLLGRFFSYGKTLNFNAGIIGDGFANAGIWGVAFSVAVLAGLIRLVNATIIGGTPAVIGAAILVAPIRTAWADSALSSTLLTHGILLSLILCWLCMDSPDSSGHAGGT